MDNRLQALYRPTFRQLARPESWAPLLSSPQPTAPFVVIPRTSVVFPTSDRELKWSDVMQMGNEALLDLLKSSAHAQAGAIESRVFSHAW